jgi:hypothetical protein
MIAIGGVFIGLGAVWFLLFWIAGADLPIMKSMIPAFAVLIALLLAIVGVVLLIIGIATRPSGRR